MIAAFDVQYRKDGRASAAAVCFRHYRDAVAAEEYAALIDAASPYIPGQFYRRELPCILKLLEQFHETPGEMVVDGYVMLGDRPGLGRHLFDAFSGKIPVIGVAKSRFAGVSAREVFRGGSRRPLYITSAGLDVGAAADRVRSMHGPYRVPTLLKRVDGLAKRGASSFPTRNGLSGSWRTLFLWAAVLLELA